MKVFHSLAYGLWMTAGLALAQNSLPIIDLGYERHQAFSFNESSRTYNFSNIPFAKPPLGDLRFRATVPAWDGPNSTTVNNGSVGAICPQAAGAWQAISAAFIPNYLTGQPFNETAFLQQAAANGSASASVPQPDPRTSEDCLQLDVVVPESIFEGAGDGYGAPILLWIYGGGYTQGEKTGNGEFQPYGLFNKAQNITGQQFIYVAINYRLGAFGWLPGPTLQQDGNANAGLYDQRTALEWVQKYIHLFGGDPNRVTVMGESAGGGSLMHQITAFNGQKGTPFAQAIPQSPAWLPIPSSSRQEEIFDEFLEFANVSSIAEARNLSTAQLQAANAAHIQTASYGTYIYGPSVDGVFASQLPGRALASQSFDPNVRVMVGHNGDEGLFFTQPNVTTEAAYNDLILTNWPGISESVVNQIAAVLYPPVYNGTYGYTTPFQRAVLTVSDSTFTCNTYYLAKGFKNQTYSYEFNVPPALHGNDITYTFAWDESTQVAPNVAAALQEYIVSFVINGNPNGGKPLSGVPKFPVYGANNSVTVLDANITNARDYLAGRRCEFWQKALYT